MYLAEFDDHRHTVHTESGDVSYIDIGAGPVALFVHGIATNAYLWHNLIPLLAGTRRCIAIDLPLHGQSTVEPDHTLTIGALADTLAQVSAGLDLGRIDLVGHDTGGAITQVFAARHPDQLRTLTLTNCDTRDNIPPVALAPTVELARAGQLAPAAKAILADPAVARAFFTSGYQNPDFLSTELVDAFLEPVIGTPAAAQRFQELIAGLGPDDLLAAEPALKELHVPTLIAWATDDEFFALEWAHWLHDTIPGARDVVEIADGKLFFPHERAADLAPHIQRHWAAVERG